MGVLVTEELVLVGVLVAEVLALKKVLVSTAVPLLIMLVAFADISELVALAVPKTNVDEVTLSLMVVVDCCSRPVVIEAPRPGALFDACTTIPVVVGEAAEVVVEPHSRRMRSSASFMKNVGSAPSILSSASFMNIVGTASAARLRNELDEFPMTP